MSPTVSLLSRFTALVLFILALSGCGGGLEGTNIDQRKVKGLILNEELIPLEGVIVALPGTAETQTGAEGEFELPLDSEVEEPVLLVLKWEDSFYELILEPASKDFVAIEVLIVVDRVQGSARVESQSFERTPSGNDPPGGDRPGSNEIQRPRPTPTPSPTPAEPSRRPPGRG